MLEDLNLSPAKMIEQLRKREIPENVNPSVEESSISQIIPDEPETVDKSRGLIAFPYDRIGGSGVIKRKTVYMKELFASNEDNTDYNNDSLEGYREPVRKPNYLNRLEQARNLKKLASYEL